MAVAFCHLFPFSTNSKTGKNIEKSLAIFEKTLEIVEFIKEQGRLLALRDEERKNLVKNRSPVKAKGLSLFESLPDRSLS